MKMEEAMQIITHTQKPKGYRVSFDWWEGCFLRGDYFPDRDEPLIETESEAWRLARLFALATVGKCLNIYVTRDDFIPVEGYLSKIIVNKKTPAEI